MVLPQPRESRRIVQKKKRAAKSWKQKLLHLPAKQQKRVLVSLKQSVSKKKLRKGVPLESGKTRSRLGIPDFDGKPEIIRRQARRRNRITSSELPSLETEKTDQEKCV